MRLVYDDGVIGIQKPVMQGFGQQDAVRHEFDVSIRTAFVPEPDLVSDDTAEFDAKFFADPFGHGACRDSSRLRAGNHSPRSPAGLETEFRQLGGFTGTGFTGYHNYRVFFQRLQNFPAMRRNGQAIIIGRQG